MADNNGWALGRGPKIGGTEDAVEVKADGVVVGIVEETGAGFPKLKPVNDGCSAGAGEAALSG